MIKFAIRDFIVSRFDGKRLNLELSTHVIWGILSKNSIQQINKWDILKQYRYVALYQVY